MQGVMYDTAQHVLVPALTQNLSDFTITLRLFQSDDTPTASDEPTVDYTQLVNAGYHPLVVMDGFWSFATSPPPGNYFLNGPVFNLSSPGIGDDTIFGWYVIAQFSHLSGLAPLIGGRFDEPVVIPPSGMTLTFGQVDWFLHDCDIVPPPPPPPSVVPPVVVDSYFAEPAIGSTSFEFAPAGGAWNFTAQSGGGGSGIAGIASAFSPPATGDGQSQVSFLQGTASKITQPLTLPAGDYAVWAMASERQPAFGGQTITCTFGSTTIGTIPDLGAPGWWLWQSDSFTLSAATSDTLTLVGATPGDHTMFLAFVAVVVL